MEKIYSIVVTFNGMEWIDRCIQSIISSSIPINVIVVDNCSTDGTVAYLKKKFSNVTLVEPGRNLGFGQGNNIGIEMALNDGADYVFLLNQDAWVEPTTVSTLVGVLKRTPEYFVLSPLQFDGTGEKLDDGFRGYISKSTLIDDLLKKVCRPEQIYEVPFVNAASWVLSRACLETVGGFDPLFFHYGEDVDYVNRIQYQGFKIGVVPQCLVYHDRGRRVTNLDLKKRVDWEVMIRLVEMKNILLSDIDIVPSQRWLSLKYIVDRINLSLYQLIRQKTSEDTYVKKKVYRKLYGKISTVIENRKRCKEKGATFLSGPNRLI